MGNLFQRLDSQCIGDTANLVLTRDPYSANSIDTLEPKIISPPKGPFAWIATLWNQMYYHTHDPEDFARRIHRRLSGSGSLDAIGGNQNELKAALHVVEVVLDVLRGKRKKKSHSPWCHRRREIQDLERAIRLDAGQLAVCLAALQPETSALQILFQRGDALKRTAVSLIKSGWPLTGTPPDVCKKIGEYASCSVQNPKKLMKLFLSAPSGFVNFSIISESIRKDVFSGAVAGEDDALTAFLVQERHVAADFALSLLISQNPALFPLTLRAILEVFPEALRSQEESKISDFVRSIYRNRPDLLPTVARYADIRPKTVEERTIFIHQAAFFEQFFDPKPSGLKLNGFFDELHRLVNGTVLQNSHPLEVALFLPELLPWAIAELGYDQCIFGWKQMLKKYHPEFLLTGVLSCIATTDQHLKTGCPESLLPKAPPSVQLSDLQDLAEELSGVDQYTRYEIVNGVRKYLEIVESRELRTGVPSGDHARVEFYGLIEVWLRHVAAKLIEKNDEDLTKDCLEQLAQASSYCGGRYYKVAEDLFQRVCCSERITAGSSAEERLQLQLGIFRRGCLDIACAKIFQSSEHNVHGFNRALRHLGERLGIPGYKDFGIFDDMHFTQGYTSQAAEAEFWRQYTPTTILDALYDAICSDEQMQCAYLDLYKLHLPSNWGMEKYGPLLSLVAARQTTSAASDSLDLRKVLFENGVIPKPKGSREDSILFAKKASGKSGEELAKMLQSYSIIKQGSDVAIESEALAQKLIHTKKEQMISELQQLAIVRKKGQASVAAQEVVDKLTALTCHDEEAFCDVLESYILKTRAHQQNPDELAKACVHKSASAIAATLAPFDLIFKEEQSYADAIEEARIAEFFEQHLYKEGKLDKFMVPLLLNNVGIFGFTSAVTSII